MGVRLIRSAPLSSNTTARIKSGEEVVTRFAVESADNKAMRCAATKCQA